MENNTIALVVVNGDIKFPSTSTVYESLEKLGFNPENKPINSEIPFAMIGKKGVSY